MPRALYERFDLKWTVDEVTGCWPWTGATSAAGYGQIGTTGRRIEYAHRLAWERHYGPIPPGAHVLHKCDNPPCIRWDHLFLGTHDDNMADMVSKGRHGSTLHPESRPRGVAQHVAKLNDEAVRVIRHYVTKGRGVNLLARLHGVDKGVVQGVRDGKTWRHVV